MKKCEFYSVHIEKGKKFVKLLKWVRGRYNGDIWRCLIRWEWLLECASHITQTERFGVNELSCWRL